MLFKRTKTGSALIIVLLIIFSLMAIFLASNKLSLGNLRNAKRQSDEKIAAERAKRGLEEGIAIVKHFIDEDNDFALRSGWAGPGNTTRANEGEWNEVREGGEVIYRYRIWRQTFWNTYYQKDSAQSGPGYYVSDATIRGEYNYCDVNRTTTIDILRDISGTNSNHSVPFLSERLPELTNYQVKWQPPSYEHEETFTPTPGGEENTVYSIKSGETIVLSYKGDNMLLDDGVTWKSFDNVYSHYETYFQDICIWPQNDKKIRLSMWLGDSNYIKLPSANPADSDGEGLPNQGSVPPSDVVNYKTPLVFALPQIDAYRKTLDRGKTLVIKALPEEPGEEAEIKFGIRQAYCLMLKKKEDSYNAVSQDTNGDGIADTGTDYDGDGDLDGRYNGVDSNPTTKEGNGNGCPQRVKFPYSEYTSDPTKESPQRLDKSVLDTGFSVIEARGFAGQVSKDMIASIPTKAVGTKIDGVDVAWGTAGNPPDPQTVYKSVPPPDVGSLCPGQPDKDSYCYPWGEGRTFPSGHPRAGQRLPLETIQELFVSKFMPKDFHIARFNFFY